MIIICFIGAGICFENKGGGERSLSNKCIFLNKLLICCPCALIKTLCWRTSSLSRESWCRVASVGCFRSWITMYRKILSALIWLGVSKFTLTLILARQATKFDLAKASPLSFKCLCPSLFLKSFGIRMSQTITIFYWSLEQSQVLNLKFLG